MAQTVSNGKRRILGSAKVEIAEYESDTWHDLGLGEGVAWTEMNKNDESIPDNGASLGVVILEQTADIDFLVWEPDLAVLQIARGGVDNLITTAGTLVSDYVQTIVAGAWKFDTFVEFTGQNSSGAKPTMDLTNPCVGSTDGDLTEGTDYEIVKVSGKWGIVIKDSVKVTKEDQSLTLTYSFTPTKSLTLTTGGADIPGWLKVRLTNTTNAKEAQVTFYKVQNVTGFEVKMNPDSGTAKPNAWSLKFHAVCDTSRAVKDQLFSFKIEE